MRCQLDWTGWVLNELQVGTTNSDSVTPSHVVTLNFRLCITGFDAHAGKAPASNTCVVPCLRCSMKTSIKSRVPLDPFSTLDTLGRWEHGFRSHIAATTRAPQCSSNVHEPWIVARFQHCLSNSTTGKSNQWAEEFGCNIWHEKYKSARKKKELHWLNH